jgi:hypothetical protein
VVRDVAPPASQVPSVAAGTLVRPEQLVYPAMRGLSWPVGGVATAIPDFSYRGWYNGYRVLDYGPQYVPQDESGIASVLPPLLGLDYAIMVPQVDPSTGLTTSGIRGIEVQAPLGTSIEFNYVATPGIVDLVSLTGSYLPFHATQAARLAAGDERPSLESLYGNQAGYVAAVTAAANSLVGQRFLLQRDADLRIQQAANAAVLPP